MPAHITPSAEAMGRDNTGGRETQTSPALEPYNNFTNPYYGSLALGRYHPHHGSGHLLGDPTIPLNTLPPPRAYPQASLPWFDPTVPTHAPGSQSPSVGVPRPTVSVNYRGNPNAPKNQSADIPPEESTSVWITNLPPGTTYASCLSRTAGTGKIYAAVVNPPQGDHTTSAAKIVFFDVEGRRRLEALASAGKFSVGSYVPRVVPNRILTPAQRPGSQSRVLIIEGPKTIVNKDYLCVLFQQWCAFDLEFVRTTVHGNECATMVWAFSSFRCQAERVYAKLKDEINLARYGTKTIWAFVSVSYGRDPCDR